MQEEERTPDSIPQEMVRQGQDMERLTFATVVMTTMPCTEGRQRHLALMHQEEQQHKEEE